MLIVVIVITVTCARFHPARWATITVAETG
jgi:hypothetical protein